MNLNCLFSLLLCVSMPLSTHASGLIPTTTPRPDDEKPKVIQVRLTPVAEPSPALRYRLTPNYLETSPGNAAIHYYRAFSPEWGTYLERDKNLRAVWEKWQANTDKAPDKKLRFVMADNALKQIDLAARKRYCDWDLLEQVKAKGIGLLLPELQGFRQFGNLLALRARFHVLDRDYPKAIASLQTGMKLGHDIGEGPTLIHLLVGISIEKVMLDEIERMAQRKGTPNLYWALAELPLPSRSLLRTLQTERTLLESLLPGLREMAKNRQANPLGRPELDQLIREYIEVQAMAGDGGSRNQWVERAALAVSATQIYPVAKKALLEEGRPSELVNKMPILQVVLIYETQNYERAYDNVVKWSRLPYHQARSGLRKSMSRLRTKAGEAGSPGKVLVRLLVPAITKVHLAAYSVDRRIACLRCLESLRHYANKHNGELPKSLDQLVDLPVPMDPMTGKTFEYRREGTKAYLTAPVPRGETAISQSHHWNFEITIAK
ncbi:MAG: hypothetical protein ACFCD0_22840 [Gemmataceae bacterium]